MSKYFNLTSHLANMEENVWEASLDEIQAVLGMPLPPSAHQYPAWWANQGRAQSLAWQGAAWETRRVDLKNGKVTFVYVGDGVDRGSDVAKLSIAEAKAGLAATFGVSPDAVEITIRG
ncbi:DUF7662 domain-containing protein [Sphingomonas arenae]|uniref:DUF7662 domain-containing protein n=1 Tax=Sphingomonas arenae TaxID=2812555 RepID=UPI001967BCA2|nr:hypothetical protein [Sphingomonas arenae]